MLGAAVLLSLFYGNRPADAQALTAYALFTTAIVFSIATISNDNLQDLKTGQLVGATPWKQQVALIIGLAASTALFLPVSTPPNAIAYATGLLDQKDFRIGGALIGTLGPAAAIAWVLALR